MTRTKKPSPKVLERSVMSRDFETILQAAVELPAEQQQELIHRLSLRLESPVELDEGTWRTIRQRRAEYESGKESMLTWEEVKARLQARK